MGYKIRGTVKKSVERKKFPQKTCVDKNNLSTTDVITPVGKNFNVKPQVLFVDDLNKLGQPIRSC